MRHMYTSKYQLTEPFDNNYVFISEINIGYRD